MAAPAASERLASPELPAQAVSPVDPLDPDHLTHLLSLPDLLVEPLFGPYES